MDEVLFPFASSYRTWLRTYKGISLPYDADDYDKLFFHFDWHERLVIPFIDSPHHQQTEIIPEAKEAVTLLAERYRIVVCTARGSSVQREGTERWLAEWVPNIDLCIYTRTHVGDPDAVAKSVLAEQYRAVALIDDTAVHTATVQFPCRSFLLARPQGIPSDPGAVEWDTVLQELL